MRSKGFKHFFTTLKYEKNHVWMNSCIAQEPDHSKRNLGLAAGVGAGLGGLTALAGSALVGLAVKSSGSHTGISVYSLKI